MSATFGRGTSTNPNARAIKPYGGMTPNPNQGIATQRERTAGMFAPQSNVPGMPTNTNPFPKAPKPPSYGFRGLEMPTSPSAPMRQPYQNQQTSNYGAPQMLEDGSRLYNRQASAQAAAPHPGQYIGDRLVWKGAASPQSMQAYLAANPGVQPWEVEAGYHAWMAPPVPVQPTYGYGSGINWTPAPVTVPPVDTPVTPAPVNVNDTPRRPRTGFAGGY